MKNLDFFIPFKDKSIRMDIAKKIQSTTYTKEYIDSMINFYSIKINEINEEKSNIIVTDEDFSHFIDYETNLKIFKDKIEYFKSIYHLSLEQEEAIKLLQKKSWEIINIYHLIEDYDEKKYLPFIGTQKEFLSIFHLSFKK